MVVNKGSKNTHLLLNIIKEESLFVKLMEKESKK